MGFQENPYNGVRNRAEKVLCSSCKLPFIKDRSPPITTFVGNCQRVPYMDFQENSVNGIRDREEKVLCVSRKLHSL